MSSAAVPQPTGDGKFEDPLDQISQVKKFKDLRKFFKTRRAVLTLERPYLMTDDQLRANGLMGPWTFNATQSLLDSLPGILISALLWIFFATEPEINQIKDPILAKIFALISPVFGPFSLLVLVYATAFACLPAGYANWRNWHAAARKYLYYDAAYGLWSQLLLATTASFASIPLATRLHHRSALYLSTVGSLAFLFAFFWVGTLTVTKVRAELFEYDYLNNKPDAFIVLEAPSLKFYAMTILGLPLLFSFLVSLFGLVIGFAASLVHLIRK